MTIRVDVISTRSTEVKVKYMIEPFSDYKIGYLGTIPSKGKLENSIYKRIEEIISYDPAHLPHLHSRLPLRRSDTD